MLLSPKVWLHPRRRLRLWRGALELQALQRFQKGAGEFEETELAGCASEERKSLGPMNSAAATRTTAATRRTLRHFADPAGILTVEGCGEFDGADCSRVAISATVQRRWGSRRRQQWAIPMKGAGTVSGKGSAMPSQAGRRWVSASITVIPNDQASDAGRIWPFATSGASYALAGALRPAVSPVRKQAVARELQLILRRQDIRRLQPAVNQPLAVNKGQSVQRQVPAGRGLLPG